MLVLQTQHRSVHMYAAVLNVCQARARQQAALGSRVAWPHRLVVGVEQVGEAVVKRLVSVVVGAEHQRFKKLAGMRQVPFEGDGIGHGLDALVFGCQALGQNQAVRPDFGITLRHN